jgi:hypothetical protein
MDIANGRPHNKRKEGRKEGRKEYTKYVRETKEKKL